jgi:hypothetical protein
MDSYPGLVQAGQDGDKTSSRPRVRYRRKFQDWICPECFKEGKKTKAQTMKWCKGLCKRHAREQGHSSAIQTGSCKRARQCDSDKRAPSSKAALEAKATTQHNTPATTAACSREDRQEGPLDRLARKGRLVIHPDSAFDDRMPTSLMCRPTKPKCRSRSTAHESPHNFTYGNSRIMTRNELEYVEYEAFTSELANMTMEEIMNS